MTPEELARKAKAKRALAQVQPSRLTGRRGMPSSEEIAETKRRLEHGLPVGGTIQTSLWPFNVDPKGHAHFDPTAGLLGSILSSATVPGDVLTGKANVDDPETQRRITGLAMLATGIPPASRMLRTVPHQVKLKPSQIPTAQALKEEGAAGFERARGMGVDYSSDAVKTMADDIQRSLEENGVLAELSPKTFAILGRLQNPPEGSLASLGGLIAARRAFQKAAGDFNNPTERVGAKEAIRRLDEFLAGPGGSPGDFQSGVVVGPAEDAARVLEEARGNYAAAKRSERLTGTAAERAEGVPGAVERAELNAAVANSGLNIGNQLRQRARDILTRPKEARGYSKEELELLKRIARGTTTTNLARSTGNLLGGGGGLGRELTGAAGAAVGGLLTGTLSGAISGAAALPMIGAASRRLYNSMVRRQVRKLDELIRKRSPLYEQLLKTAPLAPTSPTAREAFLRTLLLIFSGEETPIEQFNKRAASGRSEQ